MESKIMKTYSYLVLISSLVTVTCSLIASPTMASECERAQNERATLPSNLILSESGRRTLEKISKRSLTFRDQCRRIAEAPWMKIEIRFVARRSDQYDALTTIKKKADGLAVSTIQIVICDRYVEMIGHEFEHILEQIEGLDLQSLASKKEGGVRSIKHGLYETKRAVNAGRRVYAEYQRAKTVCNEGVSGKAVVDRVSSQL